MLKKKKNIELNNISIHVCWYLRIRQHITFCYVWINIVINIVKEYHVVLDTLVLFCRIVVIIRALVLFLSYSCHYFVVFAQRSNSYTGKILELLSIIVTKSCHKRLLGHEDFMYYIYYQIVCCSIIIRLRAITSNPCIFESEFL